MVEAEPDPALLQTTGGSMMRGCLPGLNPMADASVRSKGMTAGLVIAVCLVLGSLGSAADEALETKQLVEKARFTLENFVADPNMEALRDLLKKAKGVFIAPQILKGAIVLGASGGSGVFLAREQNTGKWSQPAFYTLGGVSFGLQVGGEASEMILVVTSDRGISAMLSNNFKLGADASFALGPVGAGVGGATAALSADIVAFARSKGLYGGVSLEGSVIAVRDSWNQAYYGKSVTPTDILVHRTVRNPESSALIDAVAKASSAQ
jgi:lipid-binding SYLF domain-containing protein